MSTVGFATLQIIPAIKGIAGNITQQIGGDLTKAGQQAGRSTGEAIAAGLDSAKGKVAKASAAVAKARDQEATASDRVGVAEAKLQALRDKGVTDVGRLAAAEAAVSKSKRDHEAASRNLATASDAESKAQEKLTAAERAAAEQADQLADSANNAGDAVKDMGGKSIFTAENMAKLGAAVGAAGIAAAGGLYKIGETFDDVADTIRVGTGATGADLDALVEVAKTVGTEVPASFEDIGSTVADLNTRLGLTGPHLTTVSKQFLELANQGIDADINQVTQALSGFGVEGAEVEGALDELFQVSQATGISVTDLANSAVKAGPGLRAFGFGIKDSAALAGQLDKAGLDADKTLAGLSRALTVFSDEGKKPKEALFGTIQEIERFTKAGDEAAAINLAAKLFGTRGAAQFVDAVKSGTMSAEDLMKATGATSDTILEASADTHDFAESWQMFKNKALVAIEPVASRVFGIIGEGMGWISENAIPALQSFGEWLGRNKDTLIAVAVPLGALTAGIIAFNIQQKIAAAQGFLSFLKSLAAGTKLAAIQQVLFNTALWTSPITWIVAAIVGLVAGLILFFTKTETGRKIWETVWTAIKTAMSAVVDWITGTAWPWLQQAFQKIGEIALWLWNNAIKPAWEGIKTGISIAWTILKPILSGVGSAFRLMGQVAMWLWNNAVKPAWTGIRLGIAVAWAIIKPVIAAIRAGFKLIGTVASWLWNEVIKPVWDWIGRKIDETKFVIGLAIDVIKDHFQSVSDKVTEVKDWIVDKWTQVTDFFSGVKDKIANAAKGMWDGIKNAFKSVINWIIRAWNSLSFTIPSMEVFGKEIGGATMSVPKLQELAGGGTIAGRTRDGALWGPGTGTSDSIYGVDAAGIPIVRVANGEGVVTESAMSGGGAPVVAALNAGWVPSPAFLAGMLPGLASGGTIGREKYGLPVGTNTGGYGSSGAVFPKWVHDIESKFGLKASTYPGHQEGSGLNKGIDWVGPVDKMQAFAEHLLSIKEQLEQVIWMNPNTGQKIGVADGKQVGPGTDQPGYYRDDWSGHANHVHTRQSFSFDAEKKAAEPDPAPLVAAPDAAPEPDTATTAEESTESPRRMKSFRELGSDVGGLVADGIVDFFGIPGWIADPASAIKVDDGSSVRTDGATATTETPADPARPEQEAPAAPRDPDAKDYAGWITKAAKDLKLPERAAVIGNATGLVESGDPMKMYANRAIPESLNYPHDAIGSDHDSVGIFQQRPGWGTVAQRMNAYESAKLFFAEMVKVAGWENRPEGDVAQAVQRSAFPSKYAQQIGRAQELVKKTGLYDRGGWLQPGGIAVNHLKKPEPVLHPDHWSAVVDQTDAVGELVGAGVGGGGDTNITVYGQTTGDIIAELGRHQWRGSNGYGSRGR